MRLSIGKLFVISAAVTALLGTGCTMSCIEDGSGTRCTAKSLKRFDGAPSPPLILERAPGAPVTIDVLYGNVLVQRSVSGKVEVQFFPFAYAGYDEQAFAQQQLSQNLRTTATGNGPVMVSVQRAGGTNGLGSDVVVRLPDVFDGPLSIVNRGDGPLNNFEIKVESVGRATALSVTNSSLLGGCWIQGSPTVRTTTVQCGETISLFDVSDEINVTSSETRHDPANPAITLRVASVGPGSRGGRIHAASGAVAATFPRSGGYVLNARSPVQGAVQEGALPAGCTLNASAPNNKSVTCGGGPAYEIVAGAQPDYVGQPPVSNVVLSYQ